MDSTQLFVGSDLHGVLDTSHDVPPSGGLEVPLTVSQIMTQALQRVVQSRLPSPDLSVDKHPQGHYHPKGYSIIFFFVLISHQ